MQCDQGGGLPSSASPVTSTLYLGDYSGFDCSTGFIRDLRIN